MKERPILFSAPMVRALLAGTKTQTRRLVKSPAKNMQAAGMEVINYRPPGDPWYKDCVWSMRGKNGVWGDYTHADFLALCPYGAPGGRLWVKETWRVSPSSVEEARRDSVHYRADVDEPEAPGQWRPSIYMSRRASRITLEITEVRIQRLHEISDDDAVAEGCPARPLPPGGTATVASFDASSPIKAFERLWRSINGDESWFANPWVWALTFKRVTP